MTGDRSKAWRDYKDACQMAQTEYDNKVWNATDKARAVRSDAIKAAVKEYREKVCKEE